jgi:GTPase SAR1 family protein
MQNGGENTKKVIIIGDGHVGKTCFVAKVTEGKFINNYHCTIGGEHVAVRTWRQREGERDKIVE